MRTHIYCLKGSNDSLDVSKLSGGGDVPNGSRSERAKQIIARLRDILARIDAGETSPQAQESQLTVLLAELKSIEGAVGLTTEPRGTDDIFARIRESRAAVVAESQALDRRRQAEEEEAARHLVQRDDRSRRRGRQLAAAVALVLIAASAPAAIGYLRGSGSDGTDADTPSRRSAGATIPPIIADAPRPIDAQGEPADQTQGQTQDQTTTGTAGAPSRDSADETVRPAAAGGPLDELSALAEGGDARAQYDLGLHYLRGQSVGQSFEQAAIWLEAAAAQGLPDAQYNIGVLYDRGTGVARDDTKAATWFAAAADQGYAKAQYALGVAYTRAKGVAEDEEQAKDWFALAADQGLAEAMFALGVFAENGTAGPVDLEQALRWYRLAEQHGIATASAMIEEIERELSADPN